MTEKPEINYEEAVKEFVETERTPWAVIRCPQCGGFLNGSVEKPNAYHKFWNVRCIGETASVWDTTGRCDFSDRTPSGKGFQAWRKEWQAKHRTAEDIRGRREVEQGDTGFTPSLGREVL